MQWSARGSTRWLVPGVVVAAALSLPVASRGGELCGFPYGAPAPLASLRMIGRRQAHLDLVRWILGAPTGREPPFQ